MQQTPKSHDEVWEESKPNLEGMENIIRNHFGMPCTFGGELGRGSYARCFRYTLKNGRDLAARIILPIREYAKTEVEVATMTLLRGQYSSQLSIVRF